MSVYEMHPLIEKSEYQAAEVCYFGGKKTSREPFLTKCSGCDKYLGLQHNLSFPTQLLVAVVAILSFPP